ncbi:VIT1/CCC1 transporter family protein [Candidatus Woesearchaeota archaeon]|nr:VIT1/CCC1 transporter family protein [Candidatus Woesearchaeota archaeon]
MQLSITFLYQLITEITMLQKKQTLMEKARVSHGLGKIDKSEVHVKSGHYIRDVVFGANDGLVSIVALVTGVAGGVANNKIVLLAGIAGAIAGAISMGLGSYISNKSQIDFFKSEIEKEKRELDEEPEKEMEELKEIYTKKGFKGKDLEKVTKIISSNKRVMLDVMIKEELGLDVDFNNPAIAGVLSGIFFIFGSLVPVLPFFFNTSMALTISIIASLVGLFILGALKTLVVRQNPFKLGLESVIVGGIAMVITYYIGSLFGVTVT